MTTSPSCLGSGLLAFLVQHVGGCAEMDSPPPPPPPPFCPCPAYVYSVEIVIGAALRVPPAEMGALYGFCFVAVESVQACMHWPWWAIDSPQPYTST